MVRVLVGTFIYAFHLQAFFGGDAITYDFFGNSLLQVWEGQTQYLRAVKIFSSNSAGSTMIIHAGWAMFTWSQWFIKLWARTCSQLNM